LKDFANGLPFLRSHLSNDALKNVGPGGFKTLTEPIKVIDGHVPLAGLDSLQRAAVNICFFRQLFLGELCGVSKSIDVPTYRNMHMSRPIHLLSMIG
jgi:hypothetical protein